MNVFDDLLEELREENLLEKSVKKKTQAAGIIDDSPKIETKTEELPITKSPPKEEIPATSTIETTATNQAVSLPEFNELRQNISSFFDEEIEHSNPPSDFVNSLSDIPLEPIALTRTNELPTSLPIEPIETAFDEPNNQPISEDTISENLTENAEPNFVVNEANFDFNNIDNNGFDNPLLMAQEVKGNDFYLRRATEEVTSLQIVEHIISAIEREQIKTISKQYDDLPVKLALHDFQQALTELNSEDHAQAEFKLMQETESWYSALSIRDKNLLVGDLRRYCENAKPALSSHALIALARFYRNSPFSEAVRSKFDMVVTRLFSRELWDDTREFLFSRGELVGQINNLYAEWSSIPLYETDEDDSDVLIGVLKFEDFMQEVTNASSIDELIKNDFFNRVKLFKENTGEKFFAPLLLATILECNVIVGNKYVELIQKEREHRNSEELSEKYQSVLDISVSDATSKTLQLIDILKVKVEPAKPQEAVVAPEIKESFKFEPRVKGKDRSLPKPKRGLFGVNKFLLAFAILTLLSLGGLYAWVELFTPPMKSSADVKKVNLDNSALKEFFSSARISKDRMYLVALPTWDGLSKDVKEDILKKTLTVGGEKGYNKIVVLDKTGKTISIASSEGINLSL